MSRRPDDQRDCTYRSMICGALLLLLLTGLSLGTPAFALDGPCAAAEPLSPDGIIQREAGVPRSDLYELAFDEPGLVGLHVSAPIITDSRPRLALFADCGSPAAGAGWVRVRETPQGLVFRIRRALSLHIRVSPEDPDIPLAAYTLRSSFVPELAVPTEVVRLAADPPAACSSGNFKPEPFVESRFVVVERSPGLEKDVDPWEDDEVSGLVAKPGVIVIEREGTPFAVSIHRDNGCGMEKDVDPWEDDEVSGLVAEPDVIVGESDETPLGVLIHRDSGCGMEKDVDPWEDDEVSGLVAERGVIMVEGDGTPLGVSIHRARGRGMSSRLGVGTLFGTGGFLAATVHAGEDLVVVTGAAESCDLHVRFFELCSEDTDHDLPLCGTPLAIGDVASGAIDGATDDDYFTFALDSQRRVAFEVGGGEDVRGVLYDDGGQRLETWAGSLVRTLGAGRFYVRVGSIEGWVGKYAVGVEFIP